MAHDTHPALRRQAAGFARHHTTDVFELVPALEFQGFYNAYAGATLPNPASIGLHESVGFRQVGVYRGVGYKLGAWHDMV
jgi:L-amino acid N-acyltransferase YncA